MAWQKSVVALAAAVVLPLTGVMAGSSAAAAPEGDVSAAALPPGSSAAVNGQLKVCGVKLCNQAGQQVQLRGMSTHGIQWFSQCVKTASLDALANDWKADVLRISMYIQEGGYETNPRKFTDMVHGYIEEATKRGMYALVDWHQLSPGDPNHNTSRAKTFFREIAQRHKNKTNIIYDIANEPNGVSWSRVKSYAEAVIPTIRAEDPDSLVLVGTHGWSTFGLSDGKDINEVSRNKVNASNLMYTFHFYAKSHRDSYVKALDTVSNQVPVFVTEFGSQEASGDGPNDFTMANKFISLMNSKKISWTNWNFSDDKRSGAVFKGGTCSGNSFAGEGPLKDAGKWVRNHIRANR